MLKKAQVVMLPTNQKAKLGLNSIHDHLFFAKDMAEIPTQKYQYLYFLSDEEIKEGDWILDTKNPVRPRQIKTKHLLGDLFETEKKIIATTDESLKITKSLTGYTETRSRTFYSEEPLPQPSDSFLKVFVEEYNKGNVITEVMVEYEVDDGYMEVKSYLKVNPKDNTITIRKVKDSWSREEVIRACLKMQHDYPKFCSDSHYPPNMREIATWTDDWIEENL